MIKQKTIIIDDNPQAIKELKEYLLHYEHIEFAGYATNREKAIALIKKESPDVVFLDVQLENDGITGFDLLKELKDKKLVNFIIVFYTGFEKYAVQAIRASAFDYLLKPVDPVQLSIVISRIQANPVFNTNTNVEKLIDQLSPSRKIGLLTVQGIRFVKLQSIVFINLEKNERFRVGQLVVHLVDGERVVLSSGATIKKLMDTLADDVFFEICRQTIINLHYLSEVENGVENVCRMTEPYQGVPLKISRNQMTELRRRFSLI